MIWKALRNLRQGYAERRQLKIFLLQVGRAHMQCALVEDQLKELLKLIGERDPDVDKWLTSETRTFQRTIEAVKARFNLPDQFIGALHKFRSERNAFTHSVWSEGGEHLRFGDRLENKTREIAKLCITANVFSKLFLEVIIKREIQKLDVVFERLERDMEEAQRWLDEAQKMQRSLELV